MQLINKIFDNKKIRTVWNREEEKYYVSIIDVILVLTKSSRPRKYWSDLKKKLIEEGFDELSGKIGQLKLKASDGKYYNTDVTDIEGMFRIIESIPSKNAEPFKIWLARLGKERIDEIYDPSIPIKRAIEVYRAKGYDEVWIEKRIKGIKDRKKLTDVWFDNGVTEEKEYAILTNEIYKTWSGMNAGEYKEYKGLTKESLRDNMSDIEIAIADIGELATRELTKKHHPFGFEENKEFAREGGEVAKNTRKCFEEKLNESVISKDKYLLEQDDEIIN